MMGIVLPLLAAISLDASTVDLAACLALARDQAPRLREAAAAESQAEAAAREARARRLPVLGFGATYRYTSEVMEQTFGVGPITRTLKFGDGHAADLNLGVALPLWTGGELGHQALAAQVGVAATAARTAAADLDLAREVRMAYYTALGRQAQAQTARLAVERLQRHVSEVSAAANSGAATEESRVRALARLRQAEQRELQAAAALDSAGIALGRLIGQPQTVVTPAGDLDASLLEGRDLSPARVQDRPDLAALAGDVERQELLASATHGRLWPRVSGDVRAHYGRPGVDLIANDWTPYATAAVSIDWPLWDAGARGEQVKQAAARARQASAHRDDIAEALTAAHATAQVQLTAAVAALDVARERADLEARIRDLVRGRLDAAAAAESEFLDAEDDLTAAQIDLALSRTRVRLAEAALLWTLGY